jgi:hypothetical protein
MIQTTTRQRPGESGKTASMERAGGGPGNQVDRTEIGSRSTRFRLYFRYAKAAGEFTRLKILDN